MIFSFRLLPLVITSKLSWPQFSSQKAYDWHFVRIALCRRVCSDWYRGCLICGAHWSPMCSQLGRRVWCLLVELIRDILCIMYLRWCAVAFKRFWCLQAMLGPERTSTTSECHGFTNRPSSKPPNGTLSKMSLSQDRYFLGLSKGAKSLALRQTANTRFVSLSPNGHPNRQIRPILLNHIKVSIILEGSGLFMKKRRLFRATFSCC